MDISRVKNVLQSARIIVENQKVEEKIKGEKFNLFSILKMETKENETHSAFLGELLNPGGSHLMGNVFLDIFLEEIKDTSLDRNSTRVILEKNIGPVIIDEDDPLRSTGGRIDIYLEDKNGNTVSIENKINAPEQKLQVVRYFNHKKERNKVYYLTLDGKEPSSYSTSTLQSEKDFIEISYKYHILEWLKKCHKESFENSILRESIKQYIILLKKITGKMDNRHRDELYKIILSNYEAVESIISNSSEARKTVCHEIHESVVTLLKEKFKDIPEIVVEIGNDVWKKNSQIWIRMNSQKSRVLNFVLESFSGEGHFDGNLFLGILNPPPHDSKYAVLPNELSISNWIINKRLISDFEGFKVNLKDKSTIQKLYTDAIFKSSFIQHIVKESREYFDEQFPALKRFLETGEISEIVE